MRSRFNHLVRGCFPGEHEAEFDGFYLAAHLFRMRSCVGIEPGAIKSCLRKMGRIVWRRNAEHFVQPNENLNWLVKKRFFPMVLTENPLPKTTSTPNEISVYRCCFVVLPTVCLVFFHPLAFCNKFCHILQKILSK